jgi:hypothetical protein
MVYYTKINFEKLKQRFGIKPYVGQWQKQPNGVNMRCLMSEADEERLKITYIGLIFYKSTDAHKYKTQRDNILFHTESKIAFSLEGMAGSDEFMQKFHKGDAITIHPSIIRRIVPEQGSSLFRKDYYIVLLNDLL